METNKAQDLLKSIETTKIRYFYTSYKTGNLNKVLTHYNIFGDLPNTEWVISEIKRLNYNCPFDILKLSVEVSKEEYDRLNNDLPDSFTLN